jgi:hypothetical protein
MFLLCPINIIGGERFTLPTANVNWRVVNYRNDACLGYYNGELLSVYNAIDINTPLIDVNWLDAYPQCQRELAALSMFEFYSSVCELKYLPGSLFSGNIDDRTCKIVSSTCRNVVERKSPYDDDNDGDTCDDRVTVDLKYSLGHDFTDEILQICANVCDESYKAVKSSTVFVTGDREITSTNLSASSLLDYVHTCATIVNTLASNVEMSCVDQDLFIPDQYKTDEHPINGSTPEYLNRHLPSIQMWFRSLDRCIYRLMLLRDDSENIQIAFLSGMASSCS